jgi:predicted O-methyltransferase YrrM
MINWKKLLPQKKQLSDPTPEQLLALTAERDTLLNTVNELRTNLVAYERGWPPGHFYSPIPDLREIAADEQRIFGPPPRTIAGIDLREDRQLALLQQFQSYYQQQPFADEKQPDVRYWFNNPNYSYGEALILYSMISFLQPRRIVEVGSGYSSCVILDINEKIFANAISCTFVEPYPELLRSLLKEEDLTRISIIDQRVQTVDYSVFTALEPNDLLFIDSSHVSKTGSDVNHLFFEVLPRLQPGVVVHFHDIGYPFEYPKTWAYQGRAWNEAYLLRAFLAYNTAFQIELFNDFLGKFHAEALERSMPLARKNPGTSIWLKRI